MSIPSFLDQDHFGNGAIPWHFSNAEGETPPIAPGPFTDDDVARIISEWDEIEPYFYSNYYKIVQLNDLRYVLISEESSGSCSYCGSWHGEVIFAESAGQLYYMALTDKLRENMPNLSTLI